MAKQFIERRKFSFKRILIVYLLVSIASSFIQFQYIKYQEFNLKTQIYQIISNSNLVDENKLNLVADLDKKVFSSGVFNMPLYFFISVWQVVVVLFCIFIITLIVSLSRVKFKRN